MTKTKNRAVTRGLFGPWPSHAKTDTNPKSIPVTTYLSDGCIKPPRNAIKIDMERKSHATVINVT